jgi:PhnB protein
MSRVCTYLNFPRSTEQAFEFYKTVFGTDYAHPITRFGSLPASPDMPALPEADRELVMHVELPILGGHVLMGTDAPESMGFRVNVGNNVYVYLEPDTRQEADRLFQALSVDGRIEMPMQDMFWGAYYGSCADRFGVQWMISTPYKA